MTIRLASLCNSTSVFAVALITIAFFVDHYSFAQSRDNICRYQAAYGGIYENGNSAAIELNSENTITVLRDVLSCMRSNMSDTEDFDGERDSLGKFPDGPNSTTTNLLLHIELASARNSDVFFENQRRIARRAYRAISKVSFDAQVLNNKGIEQRLRQNGWKSAGENSKFKSEVEPYQQRCKYNGVPIPPVHNSGKWSEPTNLEHEVGYYFFGSTLKVTDIRSFIDKDTGNTRGGFCIALRRSVDSEHLGGDPDVPGFGTICSNAMQTAACFFDNFSYDKDNNIKQLTYQEALATPYDELAHPLDVADPDVGDNCSNCHRGHNPFIVHGAKQDKPTMGKFMKDVYEEACKINTAACGIASDNYKFVQLLSDGSDQRNWQNDAKIVVTDSEKNDFHIGRCMSCHNLPALSWNRRKGFCTSILENAANKTMPPHAHGFVDITTKGVHIGWPDVFGKHGTYCFPQHDGITHDFSKFYSSMRAIAHFCLTGDFKDPGYCAKVEP